MSILRTTLFSLTSASLLSWAGAALALPPAAPQLVLDTRGNTATFYWEDVPTAEGYRLVFAPLASPSEFNSIDLGDALGVEVDLWHGASYLIAVQAYNQDGDGRYSNLEHLFINQHVVVLLPPHLREAFAAGFAHRDDSRVGITWVDSSTLSAPVLREMIQGSAKRRGWLDDDSVLALITPNTYLTLAASTGIQVEKPLILDCGSASTLFQGAQNIMTTLPSNAAQARVLYDHLYALSRQHAKGAYRFVIVRTERDDDALDIFDMYMNLVKQSLDLESQIQNVTGIWENKVLDFPQLVATLPYDGSTAQATALAARLSALAPQAVVYIGASAYFRPLQQQANTLKWLATDSDYYAADYADQDVTVLRPATSGTPGQGHADSCYDAGALLAESLNALNDNELVREDVLRHTLDTEFAGRTGIKQQQENETSGTYELVRPSGGEWVASP